MRRSDKRHWPRKYVYRRVQLVVVRRPVCGSNAKYELLYTNKRENVTCQICRSIMMGWDPR